MSKTSVGTGHLLSPDNPPEHCMTAIFHATRAERDAKENLGRTTHHMRSSKSRSRGNKNRNRPSGANIVNRVFDSSGPEGKVRGTPQQIIDKYNQLHRDAQLAGDRVLVEAYAQHAEHYTRMLAEALREQEAKREEADRQNRERQAERDRERAGRQQAHESQHQSNVEEAKEQPVADEGDSGLVETPEAQPKPRKPRKPRTRTSPTPKPSDDAQGDTPEAAE